MNFKLLFVFLLLITSLFHKANADVVKGYDAFLTGDYSLAFKEWTEDAEQGNMVAQFFLGTMYDYGRGVKQDFQLAALWYTRSAEQGWGKAQHNLGVLYDTGRGVFKNDVEAVKWYSLAAEQGLGDAQASLASMYLFGEGVEQDIIYAYMWASLGMSNGSETLALKVIEVASQNMSEKEMLRGKKLAKECVTKEYKLC